jgi:hypothetical protein
MARRAAPLEQRGLGARIRGLRLRRARPQGEAKDRRRGEQKGMASRIPAQSQETRRLARRERNCQSRSPHRIMSASALRIEVLGTPNRPP